MNERKGKRSYRQKTCNNLNKKFKLLLINFNN